MRGSPTLLRPFILVVLLRNCHGAVGSGHVHIISHTRLQIVRDVFIRGSNFPDQELQLQPFLFPLREIMRIANGPMKRLSRGVSKIEAPDGFAIPDVPSSVSIHHALMPVPNEIRLLGFAADSQLDSFQQVRQRRTGGDLVTANTNLRMPLPHPAILNGSHYYKRSQSFATRTLSVGPAMPLQLVAYKLES